MSYVECSLTIHDLEKISCHVQYGETVRGDLGYDKLTEMSVDRLNFWVNYSVDNQANTNNKNILCEVTDLQTLGMHLYKILFADEKIRSAFAAMYREFINDYALDTTKRLRLELIFEENAKKLTGLPWEFLFIPEGGKLPSFDQTVKGVFFPGQNAELVLIRSVPQSKLVQQLKEQETPLRILIVICQPHGLETLEDKEINDVETELLGLEATGRVKVMPHRNVTYKGLQALLLNPNPDDPQPKPPHILHFIGHGEAGKIAVIMDTDDRDYKDVAFNKKTGASIENPVKWITSQDIVGLLPSGDNKPRLVFLQVCKGAAPGTLQSFKSTASVLVHADIPAVVAMQYSISNDDARLFAKTFYRCIADGEKIDEAVKAGRMELAKTLPAWEHPRFGTPVVYLQSNKAIVVPTTDKGGGESQRECAKCKTPNPISSKFCKECGAPLSTRAAVSAADQPKSQTAPLQERKDGVAENLIPFTEGSIGTRTPSVRFREKNDTDVSG
mgnify:CR=1 FL=1